DLGRSARNVVGVVVLPRDLICKQRSGFSSSSYVCRSEGTSLPPSRATIEIVRGERCKGSANCTTLQRCPVGWTRQTRCSKPTALNGLLSETSSDPFVNR